MGFSCACGCVATIHSRGKYFQPVGNAPGKATTKGIKKGISEMPP